MLLQHLLKETALLAAGMLCHRFRGIHHHPHAAEQVAGQPDNEPFWHAHPHVSDAHHRHGQRRLIDSARAVFTELHANDFRIAPAVIQAVLRRCEE